MHILVIVIGSACLLIPSLHAYILPIVFAIQCGVVNKSWNMCLYGACFLILN